MRFEEKRLGDITTVKVLNDVISAESAVRFKGHLLKFISGGNRAIVLDLSVVNFIDSSGLGALISSLKSMGRDGNLVISGAHTAVADIFKLTRMDKVFRMYADNAAAVAALSIELTITALSGEA